MDEATASGVVNGTYLPPKHKIPARFQKDLRPELPSHASDDSPCGLTVEGFIAKFDYLVRAVVVRVLPKHMLHNVEDLRQTIWLDFIRGGYIDIYDPARSSPKTFMFEFTTRRVRQLMSRSQRTPTDNAFSIQNQEEEVFIVGIVDPESTKELGIEEQVTIEFDDLIERATAAIHAERIRGRRDLPWVWHLARQGYRQDEIAREMELSEGTISICMELIRKIPSVQALRDWGVENGLLHGSLSPDL